MTSVTAAVPAAAVAPRTERASRVGTGVRLTVFYLLLVIIALVFILP